MVLNILFGFFSFFVFLFGICIGSFLNCVVYRLEQKKSLQGRSFCPNCKHKLSWKDLFPVFSFLYLGGKCRYCHKKISVQYPLVEIATGLVFLLVFVTQFNSLTIYQFINLIFLFYISAVFIIIFIYDLKHYIIPDKVLFPAIIIAVIYSLLPPYSIHRILGILLAVVVASGFFLAIFLISKGKWMGFGDVKLAILMGLMLGFSKVVVALFLAFFLGAIIGLILMVFEKKNLKSELPFAPFLIIGSFAALFCGAQLISWYFNFFL